MNAKILLAAAADLIAALDAMGERVQLSEFVGSGRREGPTHDLSNGRSAVLGVSDVATTIVLYREGAEVRRIPVRLVPGEQTLVR